MKRSTKTILITLGIVTVVGGGIAIAVATHKPTLPESIPASMVPDWMLGSALEEGWATYGWYTYRAGGQTWWIRIDEGPAAEGTVLDDRPWRWTLFVDRTDAAGKVPIATGEKTWTDLGVLYRIDALANYARDDMATMVTHAARDQIEAMHSEAA